MSDLCTSKDFFYGTVKSINTQQNLQSSNQDTPRKSKLLKRVVTTRSYLEDIELYNKDHDKFRMMTVRDKLVKLINIVCYRFRG